MLVRLITISFLVVFTGAVRAADAPADFSRDVRPVLSQNCFRCHGIDDKARKAKLRLDVPDGPLATDNKSGKPVIVPGHPDQSELIRRITSHDPDTVMPPPAMKVTLTEAQKDVLRADWCRNAIDRFVLARLEREGLSPSPEADRYTLIRRVSLDLIGLPPTPEEADAFVADKSPDAYEKLVDRLLASPHYG